MKMPSAIPEGMLAPCGMNCLVCYKHCLSPRPCGGCREGGGQMPTHCRRCAIRACAKGKGLRLCAACPQFPCQPVKRLDRNYRTRYGVSLLENGRVAAEEGPAALLQREARRWRCPVCGGVVSLHDGVCSDCGAEKR